MSTGLRTAEGGHKVLRCRTKSLTVSRLFAGTLDVWVTSWSKVTVGVTHGQSHGGHRPPHHDKGLGAGGHGFGNGHFGCGNGRGRQSKPMGIIRSVHLVRELMPPSASFGRLRARRHRTAVGLGLWSGATLRSAVAELHGVSPASPAHSLLPAADAADRDSEVLRLRAVHHDVHGEHGVVREDPGPGGVQHVRHPGLRSTRAPSCARWTAQRQNPILKGFDHGFGG
jgi:hypothetical protein